MGIEEVLAFAAPLVTEAINLIKGYIASKAEDQAALIARRDAAITAMQAAEKAEIDAHATLTEATQKLIDDANAAVDKVADAKVSASAEEPTKP